MMTTTLAGAAGAHDAPKNAGATPMHAASTDAPSESFRFEAERFADVAVLRYRVPGFEALEIDTKTLLYYLYEAALCGREIILDQKYRYNLAIKRTLEEVVKHFPGNRDTADFRALTVYLKRIWFSNGIHHHYSNDKFEPGFGFAVFERFVKATPGRFPLRPGQTLDALLAELKPVMFDPTVDAKLVSKGGADVLAASAVNFYERGVTQREVAEFYAARSVPNDPAPVSAGLNSRLVRENGRLAEQVWKIGGRYTEALEPVVSWLEKAVRVAENDAQREALEKLVAFYRSGDLR
ncbi:MAG TPA: dihydrofolate reductase, partial [Gammaproteobacteria bacterium]|nr:dihydrofolate reductase [Gammaproteobacteria bacterium]